MVTKNIVPVGATPIRRYATWDDHRNEMREEVRLTMQRRLRARPPIE